jgi:hypothetical protein
MLSNISDQQLDTLFTKWQRAQRSQQEGKCANFEGPLRGHAWLIVALIIAESERRVQGAFDNSRTCPMVRVVVGVTGEGKLWECNQSVDTPMPSPEGVLGTNPGRYTQESIVIVVRAKPTWGCGDQEAGRGCGHTASGRRLCDLTVAQGVQQYNKNILTLEHQSVISHPAPNQTGADWSMWSVRNAAVIHMMLD